MKKYKADVIVRLKKGVRDPQGAAVDVILKRTGIEEEAFVEAGKFFSLSVTGKDELDAKDKLNKICADVLSNPVLENYEIERFMEI
jgi:phosphoribosylformylglycinamidine synthase